jgi:hypothetical protein
MVPRVPTVHPMASVGTWGEHQTRTRRTVRSGMAATPRPGEFPGILGRHHHPKERWPPAHRCSRLEWCAETLQPRSCAPPRRLSQGQPRCLARRRLECVPPGWGRSPPSRYSRPTTGRSGPTIAAETSAGCRPSRDRRPGRGAWLGAGRGRPGSGGLGAGGGGQRGRGRCWSASFPQRDGQQLGTSTSSVHLTASTCHTPRPSNHCLSAGLPP